MSPRPLDERIKANVVVDEHGCWRWQLSIDRGGYGQIRIGGRLCIAHRVSYEAHVGPIPDGLVIDHLCRVRDCVNPDHLRAVTPRDNALAHGSLSISKRNAEKTACIHGHALDPSRAGVRRRCRECALAYERERRPLIRKARRATA